MRGFKLESNSEDVDAEDAATATLCGWLAAMDLAPVPKVTSPMKLRNSSNQNI